MGDLNDDLKRATSKGDVEGAIALIEAGAPVSYMDVYFAVGHGWAPLIAAMVKATTWTLGRVFTHEPNLEVAQILLESGRVELDEALSSCVTGPRDVAELLIRCGANPKAVVNGFTCLQIAIRKGSIATYEWLVSLGVPEEPPPGESLMHLAHSVEMIRFLAKRGHPVDEIDGSGQAPLHRRGGEMRSDACEELIRLGADRTRQDRQGSTYGELMSRALEEEFRRPH